MKVSYADLQEVAPLARELRFYELSRVVVALRKVYLEFSMLHVSLYAAFYQQKKLVLHVLQQSFGHSSALVP